MLPHLCFWLPKWNVEKFDSADGPRFRIKGLNGEIVATSEAYSSVQARDESAQKLTRVRLVPSKE